MRFIEETSGMGKKIFANFAENQLQFGKNSRKAIFNESIPGDRKK